LGWWKAARQKVGVESPGRYDSGVAHARKSMTRQEVLDLYFLDARCKLIDLAAFLDRVERAPGEADFRFEAFRRALSELEGSGGRAEKVLLAFSDPTTEPIPAATTKAACGAYPGKA
jgi:hypothetical protein